MNTTKIQGIQMVMKLGVQNQDGAMMQIRKEMNFIMQQDNLE